MKKKSWTRFIFNLLLYLCIALSLYFLYAPINRHPNNRTRSCVQFIYQQF